MFIVNRLSRYVSCLLCVCCSIAVADPAVDHNTTRSNRDGRIDGGGSDVTDAVLNISNDMVVRKRPGRASSSDVTLDSEIAQRGSGTVKFFNNSKGFGFTAGDQEGDSDSDAIEYGLIAALVSDSDSDAIEYGLIAALMSDGDSDAIEYGLIAALMSDAAQDQPAGVGDKVVRKKPGRVAQDVGLGGGAGNNGSGTLRNNDPIPGIDVIVEKDPEENPAIDNSPVMMLNEMLTSGYSQAEVVEFALATGLIGR
jgi:Flp pilus assembly pilin Flp